MSITIYIAAANRVLSNLRFEYKIEYGRNRLKPMKVQSLTKWVCGRVVAEADKFSEHLAAVKVGEKWGFIDEHGNFVIEPQYKEVRSFHNGLAAVLVSVSSEGQRN